MECGHGADVISAADINCHFDVDVRGPSLTLNSTRKVYECAFSRFTDGKLFFMVVKPREDKTYANDARIVISTLRSIQENIEVEELV